jgi:hypothetical protein
MFVEKDIVAAKNVLKQETLIKIDTPLEVSPVSEWVTNAEKYLLNSCSIEACGVVVKDQFFSCRNISETPEKSFALHPKDYVRARMKGKITAIIHSHPKGGGASNVDIESCNHAKVPFYIFSIPDRQWLIIEPQG